MLSADDCAGSASWKEEEAWTHMICVHMTGEESEKGILGTWALSQKWFVVGQIAES